jgi:hypothetical protein
MKTIIQTLIDARQPVTIADIGRHGAATFCLALKVYEPLDLWYLSQFAVTHRLELGVPVFDPKQGLVFFPMHVIDTECFDLIVNA